MNGVTEALVKSIKKVLNAAIGDQVMSFSKLQTVMFEAAQLGNQRPIGRHPAHPHERSYLCPNDLLLGRVSPEVPQGPFMERVGKQTDAGLTSSSVLFRASGKSGPMTNSWD